MKPDKIPRAVSQMDIPFAAHYRQHGEVYACHPLCEHLFGVAALSRAFAHKIGLEEAGELLGLVHDLGKYGQHFQKYLASAVGLCNQDEDNESGDAKTLKGKIDHSSAGAQFLWGSFPHSDPKHMLTRQILALCAASHHSGLIDCLTSSPNRPTENAFAHRIAKPDEETHLSEALDKADPAVLERAQALLNESKIQQAFLDLTQQTIRRLQAQNANQVLLHHHFGLVARFLLSCLVDADRMDTADFTRPDQREQRSGKPNWDILVSHLEAHIASLQPRHEIDHLRSQVSESCRLAAMGPTGIRTLTAPTGAGKTLAQLRFGLNHAQEKGLDRIIVVVPFTSIIDQNADVARSILEPEKLDAGRVVLEHHSNLTPEEQTWRNTLLSENWDAPVVFTTMVQFLEALFGSGTRGVRRMHRLANAVVIFDEIQAVPIKCIHLFNSALNFLVDQCGTSAVLSTATQPLLHRVDPTKGAIWMEPGRELVPDVVELFRALKRVNVIDQRKPGGWTEEELAALAVAQVDAAGSCLVVTNTKGAARRLFRLCQELSSASVVHLSTSMCPAHRRKVLKEIRQNLDENTPTLCISTQLIEAGVDLDFGAVIRFLAGLDSIAQAAGRCNRHGARSIGLVHVVNPAEESLQYLPDIRTGRDVASRVLDEFRDDPTQFSNDLLSPRALERYYEYYFFQRKSEMDYPLDPSVLGRDDTILNLLSQNSKALQEFQDAHKRPPDMALRQSFKAASLAFQVIEAATQGVLVPFGPEGRKLITALQTVSDPLKERELLVQAQQFTVNVFPYEMKRLEEACAIRESQLGTGIQILYQTYYHPAFGLSTEPVANMEVLDA